MKEQGKKAFSECLLTVIAFEAESVIATSGIDGKIDEWGEDGLIGDEPGVFSRW